MSTDSSSPIASPSASQQGLADSAPAKSTQSRVAEITSLLNALEEAAAETGLSLDKPQSNAPIAPTPEQHESKLVQVRLGIANALFVALRHHNPAIASHSLRVALGCSSWALHKKLDEKTRDAVELAALFHDLGVVGNVGDSTSGAANADSEVVAQRIKQANVAVEVLKASCGSKQVLEAVQFVPARFDGQDKFYESSGENLPLEARMIAIVNAFDELTTGSSGVGVHARDEAIQMLTERGGADLDPILVNQFVDLLARHQDELTVQVASRWLGELARSGMELPWHLQPPQANAKERQSASGQATVDSEGGHPLFERKLLDAMHDGVIFVDSNARIFMWSKGAEQLTGVSEAAAEGRKFAPGLLDMCNGAGRRVKEDACPVTRALTTTSQLRQRLQILGRQGRHVAVDLHAIPVQSATGDVQGATILLHDAQPEASLEQKCEALHAEVTKDPMTKVANRAEFDRMQALFMEAHQQARQPCSLIMADIDHFKQINDTFGHQSGDEAIITVANLLQSMCRSGDLVARYGGEEFAVLCADCNIDEAVNRAEQLRRKLSETPHSYLGNKRLTASFGVADLKHGDTPEAMLKRADNALLLAKERGRNQVVQVGGPMTKQATKSRWWNIGGLRAKPMIEATLATEVPLDVAVAKLKGFVSDLQGIVVSANEARVELEISSEHVGENRRKADRSVAFRVEVEFSESRDIRSNSLGFAKGEYVQTVAKVIVRPKRNRDRRAAERSERARLIVQSLKAYLMAKEDDEETSSPQLQEAEA